MTKPTLVAISGLDPSGGAGLLTDAATARDFDYRVAGVVTVQTVQDSRGCRHAEIVKPTLVAEQLSCILSDTEVAAVKIGMVGSEEQAKLIEESLRQTDAPVVWDPILAPSVGTGLSVKLPVISPILCDERTVITPNLAEAETILGKSESPETLVESVRDLLTLRAVVITPGIDASAGKATIWMAEQDKVSSLNVSIAASADVHGTGCAFSCALASCLGQGQALSVALKTASTYVSDLCKVPQEAGMGRPTVH